MASEKIFESIKDAAAIAGGAMGVALHLARILANRGLLSPNEVETLFVALMHPIDESGSKGLQANSEENLGSLMAEIRLLAQERWIGKDGPDPEARPGKGG